MANNILVPTLFAYQTETDTHNTRVIADGGTIDRLRGLNSKILIQNTEMGLTSNCELAFGASSGYKKTGSLFDKIYDWSSNSRDLTSTTPNQVTYNATGRQNKASIDFTATTKILTSPSYTISNANSGFSYAGWLKMSGSGVTVQSIYYHATESSTLGFLRLNTSGNNLNIKYSNGTAVVISVLGTNFFGTASLDNVWIHVSVTINFSTGAYITYRNGIQFSTGTLTTPVFPVAGASVFGNAPTIGGLNTGSEDDIRIYNKVLTAAQVQRICNEI